MKRFFAPILIFFVFVSSCIYSPYKENFVEISQNSQAPVIDNQTLDLNSDTLQVWQPTRFNFDLTSSNQEILSTTIKYGGQEINFESGLGSFELSPYILAEGTYTLEMIVRTRSGTGSLADKLGAEGYEFSNTWVLIVQKPTAPEINISAQVENGFLKFTWNKTHKPYIKYYRASVQDNSISNYYTRYFTNDKPALLIDSTFVGGNLLFSLSVYYYDSDGNERWQTKNYEYNYPINITLKEDKDSLRFSWTKNPFHSRKYLNYSNGSYEVEIKSDSNFAIAAPGLGGEITYNLFFRPEYELSFNNAAFNNYFRYTMGVKDSIQHKNIVYNPALNTYFLKDEMHIKLCYNILTQAASYSYPWDYYDSSTLTFSADNQSVFSFVNKSLVRLKSSNLELISLNPAPFIKEDFSKGRLLEYLNDSTFLFGYEYNFGNRFILFNSKTYSIIDQTEQLPDDYISTGDYLFAVSPDQKFAAFCNQKGLYLFEIVNNSKFILRYSDTNTYLSCLFDPLNPQKLILNCPDQIKVFDCSNLQVAKTITRFAANPVNIDPLTHLMLLVSYSEKKIYVYDYENDVLKLKMNHHGMPFDFKLLNNIIFVNPGYHYDISSYVQ